MKTADQISDHVLEQVEQLVRDGITDRDIIESRIRDAVYEFCKEPGWPSAAEMNRRDLFKHVRSA